MRLQLQVQDAKVRDIYNIYFASVVNNVRFVKWSVLYFFFNIFYYLWKFLAPSLKEKCQYQSH